MSCCPPAPTIKVGGSSEQSFTELPDTPMLPGESTECYTKSASNPTGKHDDATENVPNKIEPPTISLKADGSIDVTFRLQRLTPPPTELRTPTKWEIKDDGGNRPDWYHPAANSVPEKPPEWNNNDPVRVDGENFNTAELRLHGQFRIKDFGRHLRCTVIASDAQGVIDNRGYVFSPAASTTDDSIRFLHPLPGAVVTSRFDPQRMHPTLKIIKPHNGADFALPGRKIGDILAAADGTVIFTGYEAGGAGNYVKIQHKNAGGKHLCTTVYMHLNKIYVAKDQVVTAGQKIGLEGNTGIGTGAHLHFECRLPNDARVDPVPYIKGSIQQAAETNSDNTAKAGTIETKSDNAVLTPANVDAKQAGCEPNGPTYPTPTAALPPPPPAPPPPPVGTPPSSTDPFELAWALTMKTEVIGWSATPPTLQTTLDGLITGTTEAQTKAFKKNVGYRDYPENLGGVTKFGIAQLYNKNLVVANINYETARTTGYTNFWAGKLPGQTAAAGKKKTAIAMFNFGYLCGVGGLAAIVRSANINSLADDAAIDAICASTKDYLLQKIVETPSKITEKQGWLNRIETVRSYAKAAPV